MRRWDTLANNVAPNFDDVTLCKYLAQFLMTSYCENKLRHNKMHLSCLIPFLTQKHIVLAINIVIAQIATSIRSSPSGAGFYVMRWVKYGGW